MMAEECVDVPVISEEVTMSRVVELRHSSSANNEDKVVPHYRRASTGSCHDFCKYGKNIAVEAKKRSFIPKLAERKQLHQSSEKNIGEVVVTSGVKLRASADSEPMKKSLVKRRESTDSQLRVSNASDTTKVIKTGSGRLVQPDNEVVVNKKKASLVKVKNSLPLQNVQNSSTYKTRRQEVSSTSKKEEPLLKSTFQTVKTNPISTSQMAKTSSKSTSKKTRTSMNLDSSKVASPRASLLKSSQKRNAGINIHKSLKTASRVKNHPMPRKVEPEEQYNEAEEKTLYVIIESEDQTFQSDQEEPKYATSELEEDSCLGNNGKENMDNLEILDLEVEENEKPQKGETENLEVLDLEVEDNEKPQKGETENLFETQIEKNSFESIKVSKDNNATDDKVDADETVAITGFEKVVLRHQDVKGKKDEQVLSNNVIEETASKLVEIQRSKVKALGFKALLKRLNSGG
ncbi:hypothetical protein P8452_58833 [Trifolium repens]|nr:hypothetical protein P8452_58833 [Trifolium repens]